MTTSSFESFFFGTNLKVTLRPHLLNLEIISKIALGVIYRHKELLNVKRSSGNSKLTHTVLCVKSHCFIFRSARFWKLLDRKSCRFRIGESRPQIVSTSPPPPPNQLKLTSHNANLRPKARRFQEFL